ncbi:MAG: ABC transporter substrate-binding protein [Taibaiella sp.]|jgi:ABC-type Fe3+ transport system substrate-binding protein
MNNKLTLLIAVLFVAVSCNKKTTVPEDELTEINRLYLEAKAEGNEFILWGGGDSPGGLNLIKNEWQKDFPDIKITARVDLSKFLDVDIDQAIANGGVVPDVAQLQTIHDFHRWKLQGALEPFKSVNWNNIPDDIKDQNAAFTPLFMGTFSIVASRINVNPLPTSYLDLLKPQFKNKMMLTYPHDDDAVLFLYKKVVDKYGWAFVDSLIAQNPEWIRGTAAPRAQIQKGNKLVTMGVSAAFEKERDGGSPIVLPAEDPFLTWPQTAAIFKNAKHKAAAKLYIAWILSKKMQNVWTQWSVRKDMPTKGDYKNYREYPNTSPVEFINFMLDRNGVEQFKNQMKTKIGPVQGSSPLTDPYILSLL